MRTRYSSLVFLILFALLCGCSGGDHNPVTPVAGDGDGLEITLPSDRAGQDSNAHLWGYYDLYFSTESREIEVVPNRSVGFAANVVGFLNSSSNGVEIALNGTAPGPGYIDVDLDLTINHPLGAAGFDGYDVMGVFIGDGSEVMDYDSDLVYANGATGQTLLNADGYTRWFNPTGFYPESMFGYVHGRFASSGYEGSATLNPYKYFGEGLGATDDLWTYLASGDPEVGYFLHGTGNTRNYQLRFPLPLPGLKYGYAVVANWAGVDPGNHPAHAAEAVGIKVADFSNLYYEDETSNGGDLDLYLKIFEWDAETTDGVMLDYDIIIESTVLLSEYHLNSSEMTPTETGDHWCKYHVVIPADSVLTTAGNEFWVIVEDSYADYTNPFGVPNEADDDPLAAFFRFDLSVADVQPRTITVDVPNGGENWAVGSSQEIRWSASTNISDVTIDLSRDSGGSYTFDVITSTPNDGSFTWDSIPIEAIGESNRIRVSDAAGGDVSDESDADFMVSGSWLTVTSPNGGEAWTGWSSHGITWDSSESGGTVNIEYSKDNFVSDFHEIVNNTPNDGSYTWAHVPLDFSSTVMIRIHSADPPMSDSSDAYFSIVEPASFIDVLTPNGGEEWHAFTDQTITWQSYGVTNVDISYSTDNFVSAISTITADLPNANSCLWERIPHDITSTARVKIEDSADPGVSDTSDGDFTITASGWAVTWGDTEDQWMQDVMVDADGNIYTCGWGQLPGLAALSKFNAAGTLLYELNWPYSGSTGFFPDALTAGEAGYFYLGGYFRGSSYDFNPGSGTDLHTTPGDGLHGYIIKFSTGGSYQWGKSWGDAVDPNDFTTCGAVVYRSGNVYGTGWFSGTNVDFDPGPDPDLHSNTTFGSPYLTRFNESGDHVWAGTWATSVSCAGTGVDVDGAGNCYVTGYFPGTDTDFDPDPGDEALRTSNGDLDVFLSWFDNTNDFLGVHTWGGSGDDKAECTAVDSLGNVFVLGEFEGTDVDFDPGTGTDLHTSAGDSDMFLSRFDSNAAFMWAITWGGVEGDSVQELVTDLSGNITVMGTFQDEVDFDPGTGVDTRISNGLTDAFWSRFDSSGNYITVRTWGGIDWDYTYGGGFDGSGTLYLGGHFLDTVEFAPVGAPCFNSSDIHLSNGGYDRYLVKYMPDGCW